MNLNVRKDWSGTQFGQMILLQRGSERLMSFYDTFNTTPSELTELWILQDFAEILCCVSSITQDSSDTLIAAYRARKKYFQRTIRG